ncbi:MAG: PD40 domain-containing protein [Planctomycetes bacterium]|nr:PD40 domain-containing protein [Planctomycetota bacterium]
MVFWQPPIILGEPNIHDTRLLSQPAVSAKNIAFIYQDDLWIADLDGKNVRRLTSDIGIESNPCFSPDGKIIAFSAQYEGNVDVYTIPVEGGSPTRLTWHPFPDIVRGFTSDGKSVLFSSPRHVFTNRYNQLFTVPLTGGMPTQLPIPNGVEASYSPDGDYIAYTPIADRSGQWKNYRGGTHSRIWIYRCKDHAVEQIPQPKDRCNDTDPNWIGDQIFFRSDRNGEYNIFSFNTKSKEIKQITKHNDFPVLDINAGGGNLIYEQAGYLHLCDPAYGKCQRLKVGVASDLVEARPRFAKGAKYIRSAGLSPSGARAVFEFRGEIVTVPVEKGDPRNLTNSPAIHERAPAWSPDGKTIAYFSDEGGEYLLHLKPATGNGETKKLALKGAGFYSNPIWSPDSKKIAFLDNSQSLFWIDLDNGEVKKIASEPLYGPEILRSLRPAWSPDSKWIVFALGNKAAYHTVLAYELATDKSRPITDGLSDALDPVFDANGKYLYFLASTDAGPLNQWFSQANSDMHTKRSIYLVVLKRGVPSPLVRESDEEKVVEKSKEGDKAKEGDKSKEKPKAKVEDTAIDFEGIDARIVSLGLPAADRSNLRAGPAGQIFYLERPQPGPGRFSQSPGNLMRYDLSKRKSEQVSAGIFAYFLNADGKKALTFTAPETWTVIDATASAPPTPGKGKLNIDAIEVRVDPRAEWPQILDEAWRINRDYFYDPNMHGCDWPAMKKKYAEFLPHISNRGDLDRVIRWMLSELAVGHSGTGPGERLHERKPIPGGLLGADYEVDNGRYRFKKVYGGLNFSPELRSPLTAPGVDVKAGEYLLAVRGIDLKPPTELYSLFENTANKSIEITVGPNADGKGSRTVTVEPLASEDALRNRAWVEGNLKKVHDATKGRVAYVYVPNTTTQGHEYFKRYFFPQADKQAIIVDERFNGGGQVADYYIDHLRRPFTAMWATRYGQDIVTPGAAIFGPKVMLIDETAGSGGDLLPWMFRQNKLGPLVGKRTWGGLVGILGFPILMDGGGVTAPNLGFWTKDGFGVENEGVPPDVDVEQWPADVIAGRDPQLERAIQIILEELERNPPENRQRPPFPIRVRR